MGQARSACSCKRVETRGGGGRSRTGVCDAQGLPGLEASDAQGLPGPPRVETLGYDWEEVVSPLGCSGKRTEVRGFGTSLSRACKLGGIGQARSACSGKRTEV